MVTKVSDMSISFLLLPSHIEKIFYIQGYKNIAEIAELTEGELLEIEGVDDNAIEIIKHIFKECDLELGTVYE